MYLVRLLRRHNTAWSWTTRAANLAAHSTLSPANETSGGPAYDPSKSTSSTLVKGDAYTNSYGSGHTGSGVVYNDTVSIGNLKLKMAFEVATSNNGQNNAASDFSGDFGMAFAAGGMSSQGPTPVLTFLKAAQAKLDGYLFTVDYNKTTQRGDVDFGFIDSTKYTGKIGYLPINANYYWGVNFTGYAIGTGALHDRIGTSVVDTGTASTHDPPDVVEAWCSQVTGSTYNTDAFTCRYPCSTILPNFVFGVNDHRAVIPAAYLKGLPVSSAGNCQSPSQGQDSNSMIFGQSFIQAQLMMFDHANGRVGFANK
ncbi:hypothetical protein LTR86_006095 [Recurvomyces mirabilis]|nr:hypothetical protein LTR86_006095 [Recurvomyces mirabilis]